MTRAVQLSRLKTESRSRASANLDTMSALELATLMNRQDARVARAIKAELPAIARAIEVIAQQLAKGGRLIYVGTGTSGRIGALDASECPPTFGTDPSTVQFVIAGGEAALAHASEISEDSTERGREDIAARNPGRRDVLVAIAASGRTPYTIAALRYAKSCGTATVAVVCNRGSELARVARIAIEVEVGPEILTGSTRLKAGTAQKLICNMLTTGAMARLGHVYGNLMVNVELKNTKLAERGLRIVQMVAGVDREQAAAALKKAGKQVPIAIIMLKLGVSRVEALRKLRAAEGNLRKAIEAAD